MVAVGRPVAARRRALQRRALRSRTTITSPRRIRTTAARSRIRTRARSAASSGTPRRTSTSTPTGARASRRRPSSSSPIATSAPASTSRCSRRSAAPSEIGVKAYFAETQRVNLAAFDHATRRTRSSSTPRQAAARRTRTPARPGAAASRREWEGCAGRRVHRATRPTLTCRRDSPSDTTTGTPPLLVPAGSRLPAVPAKQRVRRAGLDAPRLGGLLGRARSAVRRQALRQRAQYRRRAGLRGRQRPRRIRAARRHVDAARIRSRQQPRRPQLRRLGDRRRHQRPLLRAVGAAAITWSESAQCQVLNACRRYPTAAIVLHWAIAAAVVGLIGWAGGCRRSRSSRSGPRADALQPAQVDRADGAAADGSCGSPGARRTGRRRFRRCRAGRRALAAAVHLLLYVCHVRQPRVAAISARRSAAIR